MEDSIEKVDGVSALAETGGVVTANDLTYGPTMGDGPSLRFY